MVVFILIGVPGSGKTSWAKKQKLPIVNIDVCRFKIAGTWDFHPPSSELKEKAFSLAVLESLRYLQLGSSIIWDGTNITRRDRNSILLALSTYTPDFIAIVFMCTLNECFRRNNFRQQGKIEDSIIIDRFNKLRNEPVTREEGFMSVLYF